jgi:hypothetical protein
VNEVGVTDALYRAIAEASLEAPSGQAILAETLLIAKMLIGKNARYGDSALAPLRIFSKANATEQLLVRIDDKISRIRRTGIGEAADEDTLADLIGYLILLRLSLAGA